MRPDKGRLVLSAKSRLALAVLSVLASFVAAPAASASISLYDQYDNAGAIATSSQNYESTLNTYDDEVADDFTVTDNSGWFVNQVEVDGQYFNGPGPATSVNVRFYADSSGLPGTMVAERLNVDFTQGPDPGDFVIPLVAGVPLGPGLYWVSVQANQNFTTTGQWGWTDRTVSANSGAAWENPGNGYSTPCVNWGRRATTCAIDAPAPDQVFRLLGNIGAGGPQLIHDHATVYDQNGNGYLEPGETFQLDERIRNIGGATATNITSVVSSSSPGVSISQPNSAYPDIPAGGTGTNTTQFAGARRELGRLRNDPQLQPRRERGRGDIHRSLHDPDGPLPELHDHDPDGTVDRARHRSTPATTATTARCRSASRSPSTPTATPTTRPSSTPTERSSSPAMRPSIRTRACRAPIMGSRSSPTGTTCTR